MASLPVDIVVFPPENFIPAEQDVDANTSSAITGLSIFAYVDAVAVTTTLSVTHGALTVAAMDGALVDGSGGATVTISGTAKQINATLTALDNVIYRGAEDFFGADTLTVVTSDGYAWPAGPSTDTDQMAIHVGTLLTGTASDDSFTALPGNARIDALGGIDTIAFDFRLTDATVSYAGDKVIVDGPSSHTVLTGFEIFRFTDGTVNNDDDSPLIDDLFYYSHNHDVWNAHAGADDHYNSTGWHEGRDPDAFFSTTIYLSANPDVKAAGVNPLTHFDTFGWREGRGPHDYPANFPDVAAAGTEPLSHFLLSGVDKGHLTIARPGVFATANGFDYVYYLQNNPDVAAAGVDPYQHFQQFGWKEGRNPNAFFDTAGYLANYADVKAANVNPLDHYNQFGWHEGRDPSTGFDTASYLANYADVSAAHINPLTHFLQFGMNEGRSAFADGVWG